MTGKEKLTIEKIFPAREGKNQDFSLLQVRSDKSSQEGRSNDLISVFLGGNFEKKGKVAFQTVANSTISKFKLKEGSDLGKTIGRDLRITVTEKVDDGAENLGFTAKVNPSTQEVLQKEGKDILRKTSIGPADQVDTFEAQDGVRAGVSAKVAGAVLSA